MPDDLLQLPSMFRMRCSFPRPLVPHPEQTLRQQLEQHRSVVRPGSRIAIAVGSRGISNLAQIVRVVAVWVSRQGGEPFIVPAMGSHGGATPEGQAAILEAYGIKEEFVGAPIRSSLDVVELPDDGSGVRVYQDRHAYESDGIIVINRIKPHTDFHGPYESGLMKMLAIGLGKQAQALELHRFGVRGLRDLTPAVARSVLRHSRVMLGIGLIENAYEELARVEVVPAVQIPDREPALLAEARELLPGLPVDDIDILIVDQVGKDISGVGLDTNVIGRLGIRGEPEPARPRIRAIIARDLTPASHGNALGIGLADIVTRRLFEKIDFEATYENLYASTFLERGKTPVVADSDEAAIGLAVRVCPPAAASSLRIIRIQNTCRLDLLQVSAPLVEELKSRPDIQLVGPVGSWLGDDGDLAPLDA